MFFRVVILSLLWSSVSFALTETSQIKFDSLIARIARESQLVTSSKAKSPQKEIAKAARAKSGLN